MALKEQILSNFLNLYWIRPEIAIWRTLDVLKLQDIKLAKPMIDLGCGDGTFSFTNLHGSVGHSFDVFKSMKKTEGFFQGKDIHDQSVTIKPKITHKPIMKINVGLDYKKNLLEKAKSLSLYEKVIHHNLNKKLPFEDKKFETVFSNIFYWIENINKLVLESKRILKDSGKIIILVPDKNFKKNLIYQQYLQYGYSWAKILDRGIYENITKHCYTSSEWRKLFSKCGLKIEKHEKLLSKKFINFWSIGLRPYSPYVIEMANKLQDRERIRIKKRLIKEMLPLFTSFIEYELQTNDSKCFHLYVLNKK